MQSHADNTNRPPLIAGDHLHHLILKATASFGDLAPQPYAEILQN